MGRPFTLLEDLCQHALSCDVDCIEVKHKDRHDFVYGRKGDKALSFASFASSSSDAKELRDTLYRVHKKPLRTVLAGQVYLLKVRISDSFGEDTFEVKIEAAPKLDPAAVPRFTKTQGQYLAFIYHYMKIHRVAPAETGLQRYFQVSPPSIHEMIKTLERNGLIERTPGQARSIKLLVQAEHLPPLA
jgi:DNA-binding MarR family transcriptional regulator